MNANPRFPLPLAVVGMLLAVLAASPRVARADDLKEGRAQLTAGKLDEAQKSFEKAASQGFAEGRAGVGQVQLKRRQYAKAMESFQTAQKMDAGLAVAYWGQGEVLRRQEKCSEALPLLQRATELDRKFPEAQLAYGDCLVKTKQHDKAVTALSEGLKWGPKWRPRFLVALGNAEMERDSLRDAGIYFTRAREEAPTDPTPRRALGDFYVRRGTFELAVPEYEASLAMDTSDVELRYGLGRALAYAGRYKEALDRYREVVGREPDYPEGQLALGDLLYRAGVGNPKERESYASEARPALEKYVQLRPDDPRGFSLLGRTLALLGQKDQAMDALNKAEQLGDKTKETYTVRARLDIERKEYDKALADYARGDPQPEDQLRIAQLQVMRAGTAAGAGSSNAAESTYDAVIARDSTSSSARFAMTEKGKTRFRNKDYEGAVAIFKRRIALDPNTDEAYYYLGLSLKELKRYPEALDALRQSAALAPNRADRQFWLGILYAQLDSTEAASRSLSRAVELDSAGTSKNTGIALRQLGFYDLLARRHASAIQKLQRATTIDPTDWQATLWLAQGYQNSGDRAKACEAYGRTLQLKPNQADALKGKKAVGC
jgi:tetratricopeptide (TPR) repeat protein